MHKSMHFQNMRVVKEIVDFLSLHRLVIQLKSVQLKCQDWRQPRKPTSLISLNLLTTLLTKILIRSVKVYWLQIPLKRLLYWWMLNVFKCILDSQRQIHKILNFFTNVSILTTNKRCQCPLIQILNPLLLCWIFNCVKQDSTKLLHIVLLKSIHLVPLETFDQFDCRSLLTLTILQF